ncbi:hypothetical protein [Nocardioides gilvus]|uniref:hypothetical protein n=1 Tax=Nocardioides gilvus TaxID=1735589 RepID=UPI00194F2756|nr:hypothetical protein [Nocardioides gilvus]
MEQPAWDDPGAGGTMVRGALWLLQVVGQGNTFTKNELRDAFPGISQADRRIRDLRDYGWVVYSSLEDASLLREDQRFVKAGVPVWDPRERRENAPEKTISAKERQAVLARDGYMCTLCGIAGGEPYPDDAVITAVLAISQRTVATDDGSVKRVLMTECKRCRAGETPPPLTIAEAVTAAADLSSAELRRLLRWMERGRRGATELDRAWASYLRVAPDERTQVATRLRKPQ